MNGRVIATLVAGSKDASDPDIDSFDTQLLDATADFLGVAPSQLRDTGLLGGLIASFAGETQDDLGVVHVDDGGGAAADTSRGY